MLRFPLRLSAVLAKARLARISHPGVSLVQFVDAAELLHRESAHPVSHEKIRQLVSSRSPVIWIGGSEPLDHPGISHLVRAITHGGHFVFLETDGTGLRRRIHEFQPVPNFFFAVRLEPGASKESSSGDRNSVFQLAVEGLRAARLSGFFVCVHTCVHAHTELADLAELLQYARSLESDGIVVSSATYGANPASEDAASVQRKAAAARKLIGSFWWQSFSRLIHPVCSGAPASVRSIDAPAAHVARQPHADEQGVRVA